jgi:hypothetical protein
MNRRIHHPHPPAAPPTDPATHHASTPRAQPASTRPNQPHAPVMDRVPRPNLPRALFIDRSTLPRAPTCKGPSSARPLRRLHCGPAAQPKMRAWWEAAPRPSSIDQCHTRPDQSLHVVYLIHYSSRNQYKFSRHNTWAPNHILLLKGYSVGLLAEKMASHPCSRVWKGE